MVDDELVVGLSVDVPPTAHVVALILKVDHHQEFIELVGYAILERFGLLDVIEVELDGGRLPVHIDHLVYNVIDGHVTLGLRGHLSISVN